MEHIENIHEPGPGRALVPLPRRDGFTPKRQRRFLKALRKTGCVRDACRAAGISDSAAYKARKRDPGFRALWDAALSWAGSDIETFAWHLAVAGVEEEVWAYGRLVGVRRRTDPQLFRMLLQASNPARYGGRGYGSRKALEKRIRQEIAGEQEHLQGEDIDEVRSRLAERIARLRKRLVGDGKYYEEDGELIPVGYVKAAGPDHSDPAPPEPGDTWTGDDADWTKPEPARTSDRDESGDENPRFSDESGAAEPRITRLDGW
ncbi:hypothetical protein RCO27_02460 [Sphingosinicella sp. LHD-64]|uniref:hypothetical protein n=1 Tax=Sphingosinicella sp. LHD-64 TaxID=3072139 RepID=UPI00280D5CDF|nr:hypothetical protein [Sphingosinicella sp. LHD-64]MDQ8755081.1 hypothetical protein [Sphingosinicella sp. LHD-64]